MKKKSKVYYKWLFSYITIIIIMLVTNVAVFVRSTHTLEQEVHASNYVSISQFRLSIDNILESCLRLSTEISLNKTLNKLILNNNEYDPHVIYQLMELSVDLGKYTAFNDVTKLCYIYFKDSNFIISNLGKFSMPDFYEKYGNYDDISNSQWTDFLEKQHNLSLVVFNKGGSREIMLCKTLPVDNPASCAATLVISIDQALLDQYINSLIMQLNCNLLILDSDNNTIISTTSEEIKNELLSNDVLKVGNFTSFKHKGSNYVASYTSSQIVGWRYISIHDSNIFWESVRNIWVIEIINILFCLVAGLLFSYYYTNKNYNPLNKIQSLFKAKSLPQQQEKNLNEFSYIEKSIRQILDERDRIDEIVDQQRKQLRNSYLSRLLKKSLPIPITGIDTCEYYGLDFRGNQFAVLLIYIDNIDTTIFQSDQKTNTDEMTKLTHFIITNVIEELINKKYTGYMAEVDTMLACIVNIADGDEADILEYLHDIAQQALEFISKNFGIFFITSISGIHHGIEDLPLAYEQAEEALEYSILTDSKPIIHVRDLKEKATQNIPKIYSLGMEQGFINCIRAYDFVKAKQVLNDYLNGVNTAHLSLQEVKSRMFGLINIMLNAMGELNIIYDKDFMEYINPIGRLFNCKNVKDLNQQMNYIFEEIEKNIQDKQKDIENDLIEQLTAYIRDNYCDININTSSVADYFKLNVDYISNYFKRKSGLSILDYIHKLRIEKAKLLMADKRLSLKDIAEMVGYNNDISLNRVFKKYESITPGKYRDIIDSCK